MTANDNIIPQVEALSLTPRTSKNPPNPPNVIYTVNPAPNNADITAPKLFALLVNNPNTNGAESDTLINE